jgi:hypothetical protein
MSKSDKSKSFKAENRKGVPTHNPAGSRQASMERNSKQQKTAALKSQLPVLFFWWQKDSGPPVLTFDPPIHGTRRPTNEFLARSGHQLVGLAQAANDRGTAWIVLIGNKGQVLWMLMAELVKTLPEWPAKYL